MPVCSRNGALTMLRSMAHRSAGNGAHRVGSNHDAMAAVSGPAMPASAPACRPSRVERAPWRARQGRRPIVSVMPRWLGGDENTGLRRCQESSSRVGLVSGRRHTPRLSPRRGAIRPPHPPATHRLVVCREERARVAAHAGRQRRRRPASVDAANEWGHGEGPGVACASPKETGVVRRLRRAGPGSALSAPSVYSLRPNSLDARRGRLRASRVRLACRTWYNSPRLSNTAQRWACCDQSGR
jgi:hypothetical protein